MAKIGIYMPAFNVERYISDSINSIIAQDFKDWKFIVLDDGSTDNTYNIASKIQDDRCAVFKNDSHCGLIGKLKNEALGLLPDTEYVCHIGSDDKVTPDCFRSHLAFLDNNPDLAAACGTFSCFNDEGKEWIFPHVARQGFDRNILLKYMNFFHFRMYRKEAIMEIGGYSNTLSSAVDYDLALRLDEKFKLGRLNKTTYYYRQHSSQVSTASRIKQDMNAKKALQDSLDRRGLGLEIINNSPPFQTRPRLQDHFIWGKK